MKITPSGIRANGSFWCNIALDARNHGQRVATYKITHVASGKVSVGWCDNLYRGMAVIGTKLANGNYSHRLLQSLVLQDRRCELEVYMPEATQPLAVRQAQAQQKAKDWIAKYQEQCFQYRAPQPRKAYQQRCDLGVGKGPTVDDLIPVRRIAPDFKMPSPDHLHQAWFYGGL